MPTIVVPIELLIDGAKIFVFWHFLLLDLIFIFDFVDRLREILYVFIKI